MTSRALVPIPSCPHELRPGLQVCLHCRAAEREASRARLRRLAARVGIAATAIAVCAAVAMAGSDAFRKPRPKTADARPDRAPADRQDGQQPRYAAADPSPATRPAAASSARARLAPVLPEGRSTLVRAAIDGLFAERSRDTVRVHFDTPTTRTRRRDKFESIVRATLPEVYGPSADSILAAVPAGTLAGSADLLAELPSRGLRLHSADGRTTLALWPETRPGQDGPLVVTYRVVVER